MKQLPNNDPIRADQRKAAAARRVGEGARCACGETRPEALIPGSKPVICAQCQRKQQGKSITDDHHVAGKANSPVTIPIPVNDHRAELSTAQCEWPRETLENPSGDPLLKIAARIRGFVDTVIYLITKLVLKIPEALELLSKILIERLGPEWWAGTTFEELVERN